MGGAGGGGVPWGLGGIPEGVACALDDTGQKPGRAQVGGQSPVLFPVHHVTWDQGFSLVLRP